MRCEVVEVNCNSSFLLEFSRLYTNLEVLLNVNFRSFTIFSQAIFCVFFLCSLSFEFVNATALIRLIFLQGDDHLETKLLLLAFCFLTLQEESRMSIAFNRLKNELVH